MTLLEHCITDLRSLRAITRILAARQPRLRSIDITILKHVRETLIHQVEQEIVDERNKYTQPVTWTQVCGIQDCHVYVDTRPDDAIQR